MKGLGYRTVMGWLRKTAIALGLLLLFAQCAKQLSPAEAAMSSAQQSYERLLKGGDYEAFLKGRADADSLPQHYREELLLSYKQFAAQQKKAHKGICSVTAGRAVADTVNHIIQVFLMINYADSVQEEIVVPMVERGGEWKMK